MTSQYPQPSYPRPPYGAYPPPPPKQKKTWPWFVIPAVIVLCGFGGCTALIGGSDNANHRTTTAAPITSVPVAPAPAAPELAAPPSSEAAVTDLAVPDLAGINGAVAGDRLENLGFTNVQYASATPGKDVVLLRANWTVVSVEPGPGTVIPSDSVVVVTMTKNNA